MVPQNWDAQLSGILLSKRRLHSPNSPVGGFKYVVLHPHGVMAVMMMMISVVNHQSQPGNTADPSFVEAEIQASGKRPSDLAVGCIGHAMHYSYIHSTFNYCIVYIYIIYIHVLV